ncbi:MAG: DUF3829 domain-containing protein [Veillonella dispar]|uniref:DUF3829 domain-containing protein n=1 Tax=Veillonella TaxID=29465 RepID=UPI0007671734|nr:MULTISPECIES: DUF3829 domain-containing protein [Veillonella]KXB82643.1 hypothetical protein HMPREF1867_01916 [Veillonella dispar]MDU1410244.1 DUF3829 domain-containing protein [Veillonella sp.]MDU4104955.1 DUF3829 domain-containing protein [Veillonella sp.]MDU4878294.1 DUF3829 domain-containing protein [Veillonella dispar]MDU4886136.1 DUF3829 domain-containing protein [Veillonella dispar]
MSGQNWWHRIGLVVCIVASVGVVSGCEFNMDNLKTNSQVKATQSDSEKEIWRVFRFYLAATNEFNFTSVKYSHQHMETVQQAQQNVPLAEFKVRDYERLEQELIAAREAGHTHSDLEAATDALLPVLHDVVVVVKELDTYYKEKRYESDNYAFAHTQLEKLSSLIEAFGPKYNALDTIVKTYHKQEGERLVKLMRNNGQTNGANMAEMMLIYSGIVDHIVEHKSDSDFQWVKAQKEAADGIGAKITAAEAQNRLEQKRHLDNAIEDFMANPSSETEEAVVEQYNEMVRSPMNFKLLDSVQKPYVPQEL